MKATAKIEDLRSSEAKNTIIRNLSRIMDVRILDVDIVSGILSFLYNSPISFDKVKQELRRIGHPITNYTCTSGQNQNTVVYKEIAPEATAV